MFFGYIYAVVDFLLRYLVGSYDVADWFCSESCHVFELLKCVPLCDMQELLVWEDSFHFFFLVEASSGNSLCLYAVFLELGKEPGCADAIGFGDFFSGDEWGVTFCKFLRCAVDRRLYVVSYLVEFILGDSYSARCQTLEWYVVLFDKDVDGVTAYLKHFGSFSDTEEVLLKKILASFFFCVLLFQELFLSFLSGFVC